MGDMSDAFREMKAYQKNRKAERLAEWHSRGRRHLSGFPFIKVIIAYTDNHFGIELQRNKGIIYYWPSTAKWQYQGKMNHGNLDSLIGFISKRMKHE